MFAFASQIGRCYAVRDCKEFVKKKIICNIYQQDNNLNSNNNNKKCTYEYIFNLLLNGITIFVCTNLQWNPNKQPSVQFLLAVSLQYQPDIRVQK